MIVARIRIVTLLGIVLLVVAVVVSYRVGRESATSQQLQPPQSTSVAPVPKAPHPNQTTQPPTPTPPARTTVVVSAPVEKKSVLDLPVLSGDAAFVREKPFSIGGVAEDRGFGKNAFNAFLVAFDLGRSYRIFSVDVGVGDDDGYAAGKVGEFWILLDGNEVARGKVRQGEKPHPLRLDVIGGRSLQFKANNQVAFGNPTVSP